MIIQTIEVIIKELGATGVLLLGLLWIMLRTAREIARPLNIINHEIGEIRDLIKEALTILKHK